MSDGVGRISPTPGKGDFSAEIGWLDLETCRPLLAAAAVAVAELYPTSQYMLNILIMGFIT